jgi:hypothetical protein
VLAAAVPAFAAPALRIDPGPHISRAGWRASGRAGPGRADRIRGRCSPTGGCDASCRAGEAVAYTLLRVFDANRLDLEAFGGVVTPGAEAGDVIYLV